MQKISALYQSGASSSGKQPSHVDTTLQEARSRVAFPLPNVLLLFHADGFYNLRGDPQCNLQLSDEIKYQLLFAANAHKDDKGIAHLGQNFSIQFLSVHDLVLLYRILNSYLSQDRYQSSGRGVFHRHVYEIEKRLHQLCLSGSAQKEEVFSELKGWKDSTLDPLILKLSSDDSVFTRMNTYLTQWCEDKVRTPEYLGRIITTLKLEEDYVKNSNIVVDSEKDDIIASLRAEVKTKEETIDKLLVSILNEVDKTAKATPYIKELKAKIAQLESEKDELEIFMQQLLEKDKSERTQMDGDTLRRVQDLFERFTSLHTDEGTKAEMAKLAEENIKLGRSCEFELQRKASLMKKATGHIEELEERARNGSCRSGAKSSTFFHCS